MHILITNDDGVLAPGIVTLADILSDFAKVTVIAPDRNMSGVSSAISLEMPLRVTQTREGWYQLNGTPADCIKLGLSGFLNEEPDMVISGINDGPNLGDDAIYSGTVGGAIEGRFLKFPSMAISMVARQVRYYDTASKVVRNIMKKMIRTPLTQGLILSVNIPDLPFDQIKGIQVTRQGDRDFSEPLKPTEDGRGKRIYWLGEAGKIRDGSYGTDFHAVHQGFVSITPMQVDLTAHDYINRVQNWASSE